METVSEPDRPEISYEVVPNPSRRVLAALATLAILACGVFAGFAVREGFEQGALDERCALFDGFNQDWDDYWDGPCGDAAANAVRIAFWSLNATGAFLLFVVFLTVWLTRDPYRVRPRPPSL